jgi:glycosyltransferase involved in cell wall biosynthesis/SAM-dependent methyltransferase
VDVCTIIAKNYLGHARVLARSLAEHEPEVGFKVLIIDDIDGYVDPAAEPFEVVTPAQLDIDGFDRMAVIYNVLELSTAVKPWLLRWMLANDPEGGAVYLDPDMRAYARLTEMFQAVRDHGLVLNPHNTEAMPRDGHKPNEQDILIAGVYNLGFIGIGSGDFADLLLDWWGERLEQDCIVDPERGFFVDQRWIDLVPGMAESFHVLRDPGFNVAYWNLATREVSERDGAWYVKGDVPLRLFHFSGFDASRPHMLSKHQDRIRLGDHPDLARLCSAYAEELIANGARDVADWPYTYDTSVSGLPLDRLARRVYRDLMIDGFDASVFEATGEAAFAEAATAPAPLGGEFGVTRYLSALYDLRGDLQSTFPNLGDAADARGFLDWAHAIGRAEVPIPEALLPRRPEVMARAPENGGGPAPAAAPEPAPVIDPGAPPPDLGVNVVGYLNSELGVGEVARQVIEALDAAAVPALPVGLEAPRSRQGHAFTHVGASRDDYPVNLVCVNADMLPALAAQVGDEFFEGRHTIGLWWWEASVFPDRWHGAFEHVDEVWAGSAFVARSLAAVSPVPVVRMPMPVTLPPVSAPDRAALGLPDGFVFLLVYDFNSVFERKNPLGLLEAFLRAFPDPAEGATLVLKSINAEHHPSEHERLRVAAADHPHVHLLDYYVSVEEKNGLIAACDCYASLHRSEGFGLTMAEAMLLGKPVLATGYSGNVDFMRPENSYLVDHELAPIGPGHDPYPPEAEWADPSLDHAARLMREVFEDRDEARRRGETASADIRRVHSAVASGQAMARRLTTIRAGLVPTAGFDPTSIARREAAGAQALVQAGSGAPAGGRLGRLRRAPRSAVLRLMKPHTAYAQQVDRGITDALMHLGHAVESLEGQTAELARRQRDSSAVILRELRSVQRRLSSIEVQAAGARVDDLARQADELRALVAEHGRALGGVGLTVPPAPDAYPAAPPGEPWTHAYNDAHRRYVAHELEDAGLLARFREREPLPAALGAGFDERVVEFPWLAAQRLGGRVLDAGSTLNHLHVLERLRPRVDDLHIVTLAPEEASFPQLGISYLYADLRALPLADAVYDRVLSISTLEHVGTDTTYYGGETQVSEDPQRELLAAVAELRRVLRPGGDCYITVPVGRGERFAWVRSLTPDQVDEIAAAFAPAAAETEFFRYADGGWQRSDRAGVADARYRDHFTSDGVGPDGVVAAEAVACLHLVR